MIIPDTALAYLPQLRSPALVIAYSMTAERAAHALRPILAADHGQVRVLPGPDTN